MRLSIRPAGRRGFTLIELLVVIGIIAVLIGLAAGAYFRVAQSQNQKRTETTIKKVAVGVNTQWNAVIDDVKNEIKNNYPMLLDGSGTHTQNAVNTLWNLWGANTNDRDKANALYMKMRLMQEFPQTFAEARNPVTVYAYNGSYVRLAAKQFYVQSLATISSPGTPQGESAILLYLNLTQTRRGAGFNADDIGGGSKAILTTGGTPTVFVDAWGNPISFERWSVTPQLGANILAEFSAPPYTAVAGTNVDPQDPLNKLFNQSLPPSASSTQFPPFDGQNRSPVVFSLGPDQKIGTFDDIMSFRLLVEGQRGN